MQHMRLCWDTVVRREECDDSDGEGVDDEDLVGSVHW